MNVLFIYPRPNEKKNTRFGFSLSIAYASSILKEKGFFTSLIDLSAEDVSDDEIIQFIQEHEIQFVFVEMDSFALNRSSNEESGLHILKIIGRTIPEVIKVAFGYACMLDGTDIKQADITLHKDILSYLINIHGDIMRGLSHHKPKPYNLDCIPLPDRDLFESIGYYAGNKHSTLLQTSRGCLNGCTFCQRRGWQDDVQFHSDDYVYKEMEFLQKRGYKNVWIQDENFTFNLARAKRILKQWIDSALTHGMKLAISSWTKIDYEFLELAAAANVKIISMGIESANQEVLEYYAKSIDLKNVKELVRYADSLGIFTVGNFIIGAPMENLSMIQNTFSFIKSSGFDQVNIKTLDYMIGSKLYESLPRCKYPNAHYFCCTETGLGQFPLKDLHQMKVEFIREYRMSSQKRLTDKIIRCGTPYDYVFVQDSRKYR